MQDYLIENATIVDGTGATRFSGSVTIKDSIITTVNESNQQATEIIDAKGLILCPGFIDAHSHGDRIIGSDFAQLCKTSQGITTEITGQCGSTCFPVVPGREQELMSYHGDMPPWIKDNFSSFRSLEKFTDMVAAQRGLTANYGILTGHTALRIAVMGYDNKRPTSDELNRMKALLRESMRQGSMGLSTGLLYSPGGYADIEEIAALCEVVADFDGIYATHMRDESSHVVESVQESIAVARRTGVRLWISHHKICGKANWGLSTQTLKMIDSARKEGLRIMLDAYPYTASMSKLSTCLPTYCFEKGIEAMKGLLRDPGARATIKAQIASDDPAFDGRYRHCGGFEGIMVAKAPSHPEAEGKTIAEFAEHCGKEVFDAYFDLVTADGNTAYGIYFMMSEEDLFTIMHDPYAVVGSDGVVSSMHGKTHPRGWGSFPRAISLYVKEKALFSLEEMIHKMTGLPANGFSLEKKGRVKPGCDADLLLLDYDALSDRASYATPTELSSGIRMVMTGGKIVARDGVLTGETPGRFLPYRRNI